MLPFGYRMAEGKLGVHPQESKVVVGIFDGYLSGVSPAKMADRLNEQGIGYSETAPSWNKNRLYRILADDRYAGTEQYPQIISEECLASAKERIERNRTYRTPDDLIARGISAKMRCACGGKLKRDPAKRWRCRECGLLTKSENIERGVKAILARLRVNPDLAERGREMSYEPTREIMRLSGEIARAMNAKDADEKTLREKIVQCAALKYEAFQPDLTEYIIRVIAETPENQLFDINGVIACIKKIASKIVVTASDSLRIKLVNGATFSAEKEEAHGNHTEQTNSNHYPRKSGCAERQE